MDWYSFCGIFKWELVDAAGQADPATVLMEERIVLFFAEDFDHAIRLGETEAELYRQNTGWPNKDGRMMKTRYLGVCNVFAMKASPAEGVEAYSRLLRLSPALDDDVVLERLLGSESEKLTDVADFDPDLDRMVELNRRESGQ